MNAPFLALCIMSMCLLCTTAAASHIRGGEITVRRLDSQQPEYEISLRGYSNSESDVLFATAGMLDLGDGTTLSLAGAGNTNGVSYSPAVRIDAHTWLHVVTVKHSYASAGTYLLTYKEPYRSENILNINNSVNTPFYIETLLVADPLLGINSTPVFRYYPTEKAFAGKTYHHQPGAFDADGDSLSYKLTAVRQDENTFVNDYRYPQHTFPAGDARNGSRETGESPSFSINPVSGDIIWDAPATKGSYNIAFWVAEWRKVKGKYYLLSRTMRDMIIEVEDDQALYPSLAFPFTQPYASPPAGEKVTYTITAQAPSAADSVVLEIWGDLLLRSNATASSRQVKAKGTASISIQVEGEENMGQHYQLIARSYYPNTPSATRNRAVVFYQNEARDPLGSKQKAAFSIQAYPNPVTTGKFYFSLPAASGAKASFSLVDMQGRVMYSQPEVRIEKINEVELGALKAGVYVFILRQAGATYLQKLLVQ